MWTKIGDFLLKAHGAGLGHDAVIEILIALLGVMVAVLTLIAGLVSVVVAVVGWFGFQAIREEAKKKAGEIAAEVAALTAERVAHEFAEATLSDIRDRSQASGLSESQAEGRANQPKLAAANRLSGRKKATSDKGLRKTEGDK